VSTLAILDCWAILTFCAIQLFFAVIATNWAIALFWLYGHLVVILIILTVVNRN